MTSGPSNIEHTLAARLGRRVVGRHVFGARQLMVGPAVIEADRRLAREPAVKDRVPKPRAPLTEGATREARGKPACAPNAPQLIRLVRTPYSVTPTFNGKQPARDRVSEREVRKPHHEQISEALDRPYRPGLPGIFRERPAAPAPRLWRLS